MKIVILGPVASGKTTLSKTLAERLQIPRYEIDEIVHNDETKEKRTKQEQQEILNKILKEKDEWIIEGMPRSHLEVLSICNPDSLSRYIKRRMSKKFEKKKEENKRRKRSSSWENDRIYWEWEKRKFKKDHAKIFL